MTPSERMLREIAAEAEATASWTGRARLAPRVLAALAAVRREAFMPDALAAHAYENRPQPIGCGQTISQPFIVALMTDLLDPAPEDAVLEIGTGSGYQAAVLARLVRRVCSLEVIPELARRARAALAAAGVRNVVVREGDGALGWPETPGAARGAPSFDEIAAHGAPPFDKIAARGAPPFDKIIVTAAAREVPPALLAQLRAPGRMVIPLGPPGGPQHLRLIEKDAAGNVAGRDVLDVAFVPFTGAAPNGAARG